jgi:hypothetical protein
MRLDTVPSLVTVVLLPLPTPPAPPPPPPTGGPSTVVAEPFRTISIICIAMSARASGTLSRRPRARRY